jgi:hypothetical protein
MRPLPSPAVGYEETGRGRSHGDVRRTYVALMRQHRQEHYSRGEPVEFDLLMDQGSED